MMPISRLTDECGRIFDPKWSRCPAMLGGTFPKVDIIFCQSLFEDGSVFCFGRAIVLSSSHFEPPNQCFIKFPDGELCHGDLRELSQVEC